MFQHTIATHKIVQTQYRVISTGPLEGVDASRSRSSVAAIVKQKQSMLPTAEKCLQDRNMPTHSLQHRISQQTLRAKCLGCL